MVRLLSDEVGKVKTDEGCASTVRVTASAVRLSVTLCQCMSFHSTTLLVVTAKLTPPMLWL